MRRTQGREGRRGRVVSASPWLIFMPKRELIKGFKKGLGLYQPRVKGEGFPEGLGALEVPLGEQSQRTAPAEDQVRQGGVTQVEGGGDEWEKVGRQGEAPGCGG